jgi:DNA primase
MKGLKNIAGDGAEGRARMAKKADQMLSNMSDDYLRQAWQGEIEKESGVKLSMQKRPQFSPSPRQAFKPKTQTRLSVSPMKHDRFMAALLQKPKRFHNLPEDAFDFFVDTHPIHPIYTRAFSLVGVDESTELDIAAQLMREFPDNQNIARWVNLPNVEDDEFQMLLIDMHITYLDDLRGRSDGLAVKMRINEELKALRNQQKQLLDK